MITFIDGETIIRKILTHLGLWAPQHEASPPSGGVIDDPPLPGKNVLTYHPVPDIA